MSKDRHEMTLFASDPEEAQKLQKEAETVGYEIHVVVCGGEHSAPYLQGAFTKIVGHGNIRRFLGVRS